MRYCERSTSLQSDNSNGLYLEEKLWILAYAEQKQIDM